MLLLDLDQFKHVNDSLGHAAGDDLLVAMAPRLHDAVRPSDTVARLGGDEFLVVCEQLDGAREAIRVAERVAQARRASRSCSRPASTSSPRASASRWPTADARPDDLLRDADAAMYRAKERGRGRYELFDDVLRERVLRGMRTENELRRALERGELRVVYQPVVELDERGGHRRRGARALAAPERGLLDPGRVHPGRRGLRPDRRARRWVLAAACRDGAALAAALPGAEPLLLCVNARPRQLAQPGVPGARRRVDGPQRPAPGSLALEITESVLMEEAHAPVTVLDVAARVRAAADARRLRHRLLVARLPQALPARRAQDRPLVRRRARPRRGGLRDRRRDRRRWRARSGCTVVAEGVERPEQLERLRELGCDRVQGRLIAEPMPASGRALMGSATA